MQVEKSGEPENKRRGTGVRKGGEHATEEKDAEPEEDLPLRQITINKVSATALLDSGAVKSFIRREICKLAGLQEEKLAREQQFVCANGKRLSVTHQVKRVPVQIGANVFHLYLLIADASQELLLGYDFLKKYMQGWNLESGDSNFHQGEQTTGGQEGVEPVKVTKPVRAQAEEEEVKKLTWTQEPRKRMPKEVVKAKREQDRIPFRKASAEEEQRDQEQKAEEGAGEEKSSVGKAQGKKKERRRSGEDTPFIIANVEDWERKESNAAERKERRSLEASTEEEEEETEDEVGACSTSQFRRWVKKEKLQFLGAIETAEEEQNKKEQRQSTGNGESKLGGLPEEYPIKHKPSAWSKDAGEELDEEVGVLLDEFTELFQELPKGGAKGRTIKHHIQTVPGEVPVLSGFYNPAPIVIKYCPIFKNDDRCENAPMPERPDHAEIRKPSGNLWLYWTGT